MDKQSRKFEMTDRVEVMNNSNGRLIYVSPQTREQWILESHGDTDFMTLGDLVCMRSSNVNFFRNNWIKILDEEVEKLLKIK